MGTFEVDGSGCAKLESGVRGLGTDVAIEALHFAVQHDLLLKISCKFVRYYINEYEPRYLKYVLY
ncbi:GH22331 [Drosophila grimshawi]|uniref:GH22331 n=1 Tax=Drosophila grimshawi TaxID=7222 RepID=B4JYV6_DROGR|nr:GH22331 [Drosophila grimshawi]